MKLPVQTAAVLREGYSWPARRSSVHGVSASRTLRSDYFVCKSQATGLFKCNDNLEICKCPSGACNCCSSTTSCQDVAGKGCQCT